MKKEITLIVLGFLIVAVLGCQSLIDRITPTQIPAEARAYADVNDSWPTLYDAVRIKHKIIINHRTKQIDLLRMARDDKLAYQDAIDILQPYIDEGQAFQDLMIGSEDKPYSILGLLAAAGIGLGGLQIGRKKFKRPGDLSPQEVEAKLKSPTLNNGKLL